MEPSGTIVKLDQMKCNDVPCQGTRLFPSAGDSYSTFVNDYCDNIHEQHFFFSFTHVCILLTLYFTINVLQLVPFGHKRTLYEKERKPLRRAEEEIVNVVHLTITTILTNY